MTIFLDTSGLYAVLDRDDKNHLVAKTAWAEWLRNGTVFVTHNYVLLEITALLQNRLGVAAVRALYEEVTPLLQIEWVTADKNIAQPSAKFSGTENRHWLTVLETMRNRGLRTAFCFEKA